MSDELMIGFAPERFNLSAFHVRITDHPSRITRMWS